MAPDQMEGNVHFPAREADILPFKTQNVTILGCNMYGRDA